MDTIIEDKKQNEYITIVINLWLWEKLEKSTSFRNTWELISTAVWMNLRWEMLIFYTIKN